MPDPIPCAAISRHRNGCPRPNGCELACVEKHGEPMSDFAELVEWDWVVTPTGNLLHHADLSESEATEVVDWARVTDIAFSCGSSAHIAFLPGLGARMSVERCRRCCDALGYPHGTGSPKNDDACRPLVEARLAACPDTTHDTEEQP